MGIDLAGVDLRDVNIDDIDPSLFTPIAGLTSKEMTVKQIGQNGVNDMIVLDDLDEKMILKNLSVRYNQDIIYTYIGSILVAVNSFKQIKGAYDHPEFFRKKSLVDTAPHIYALSEKAFSSLLATGLNQSFIISGESGAGKTESMKLICRYMASIGGQQMSDVQTNILNVNIALEAFGNAKTVYNNNSSRFGKFTELQFDENGLLCGARVRQYLLEKSRVVRQAANERNYHVFYYVIQGSSNEEKQRWGLTSKTPESFFYLSQSGCTTVPNIKDMHEYIALRNSMTMFSQPEAEDIFRIIAAILHLGNIQFINDPEKDIVTGVANLPVVQAAATTFGIEPDDLANPLIKRSSIIRGERIFTPLTETQAKDSRDALSKTIYGQLFNYIISKVNQTICHPSSKKYIGVLDIFGFENFQKNSLEQFCINLANEQLQDFFNEHIFKLEQMEYKHEGVKVSEVNFVDNKPCLDMIMDVPNGLLDILDEQSYFPKATVDSLLNRFDENFKGHPNYERDRQVKIAYVVKHYAEKVSYNTSDFLEKNRDTISSDLLEAFARSKLALIHQVLGFTAKEEPSDGKGGRARADTVKRKIPTVCLQFKTSLDELMTTLRKTQPYFVRCIKPNQQQTPNNFIDAFVLKQLQYSGMLETVRIRRQGFPVRFAFQDFIERFQFLLPPDARQGLAQKGKAGCTELLNIVGLPTSDYMFGKTKLFLKDKPASILENRLAQIQAERMAKLKAEIERKKKEEEERRRQEEAKKAEEIRRAQILEEERLLKLKNQETRQMETDRRMAEEQRLRVVVNIPAGFKLSSQDDDSEEEVEEEVEEEREVDASSSGSDGEAEPEYILPPPPPPVPEDYLPLEEVIRQLAQKPNWMVEKKLKKMLEAYKEHDKWRMECEKIKDSKKAEEEALLKLPPWKREAVRKQKEEEREKKKAELKAQKKANKKPKEKKKVKVMVKTKVKRKKEKTYAPMGMAAPGPDGIPPPFALLPPGTSLPSLNTLNHVNPEGGQFPPGQFPGQFPPGQFPGQFPPGQFPGYPGYPGFPGQQGPDGQQGQGQGQQPPGMFIGPDGNPMFYPGMYYNPYNPYYPPYFPGQQQQGQPGPDGQPGQHYQPGQFPGFPGGFPGQFPPGGFPGQFPPGQFPQGQFPPGQFPPGSGPGAFPGALPEGAPGGPDAILPPPGWELSSTPLGEGFEAKSTSSLNLGVPPPDGARSAPGSPKSSRGSSPAHGDSGDAPSSANSSQHLVSVDTRRQLRTESQFYPDDFKIEEAPPIPEGTLPLEEITAKLAKNPGWKEEKELKKMLGYYKEREKWEKKNQAALEKAKEEEAKLMALPAWKRDKILKERGINPANFPSSPTSPAPPSPSSPSPLGKPSSPASSSPALVQRKPAPGPHSANLPPQMSSTPPPAKAVGKISTAGNAAAAAGNAADSGDIPAWKQALVEKKKKEMAEKLAQQEAEERAKLDALPKWKRALAEKGK